MKLFTHPSLLLISFCLLLNVSFSKETDKKPENKNILNTLKEIGVDFAQGYFLGKPVLLDEALNHESFNEQRIACSEN